eukprot:1137800-Pelagomonas_calceolata.AAC.3
MRTICHSVSDTIAGLIDKYKTFPAFEASRVVCFFCSMSILWSHQLDWRSRDAKYRLRNKLKVDPILVDGNPGRDGVQCRLMESLLFTPLQEEPMPEPGLTMHQISITH